MKLSEAIRLGAMTGPQCYGNYYSGEMTCAIGAALKAVDKILRNPGEIFPGLRRNLGGLSLATWIVAANDSGKFTREQIADLIVANGWDCDYAPLQEAERVEECVENEVCAAMSEPC